MQQGNWLAFLFDSYRQVLYPPLYAWGIALSFLVGGYSIQSAGIVSLISFALTIPVLYKAASYLRQDNQAIIGGTAAILFLGTPILISFATQTMLEITGLFFFSVTIVIYLKTANDKSSPYAYIFLGIAVALTYMARIQYGVLIFLAIVMAMLLEVWLERRPEFLLRLRYFLIPLFLIFGLWFAYYPKLFATLGWLVNSPNVSDPYSLSGWLFYPLATVRLAGSFWMFSLFFAVIFISAVRFGRDRGVRFLLVVFVTQMILGIFHHNRQDRYLLPILPSVFLLTGLVVAEVNRKFRNVALNKPLRLLAGWGLVVFIIFAFRRSLFLCVTGAAHCFYKKFTHCCTNCPIC
jgi:4-amino-4-deoxy-L-arabinose transferase-like glycosyltransferase